MTEDLFAEMFTKQQHFMIFAGNTQPFSHRRFSWYLAPVFNVCGINLKHFEKKYIKNIFTLADLNIVDKKHHGNYNVSYTAARTELCKPTKVRSSLAFLTNKSQSKVFVAIVCDPSE